MSNINLVQALENIESFVEYKLGLISDTQVKNEFKVLESIRILKLVLTDREEL